MAEKIEELALRVLVWARKTLPRGTVRDVFAWRRKNGTAVIALHGPADKMQRHLGFDTEIPNPQHRLDQTLAAALGLPMKVSGQGRLTYVNPQWFEDESVCTSCFLEGIERGATDWQGDLEADATLIPEPGYPWAGEGTAYYSADARAWRTPSAPPWTIDVQVRDEQHGSLWITRHGADWCVLAAKSRKRDTAYGWADLDGANALVTHCFSLGRLRQTDVMVTSMSGQMIEDVQVGRDTANSIRRCQGLVFPSLAVGEIPATPFGPAVLVADPRLVLDALSPFKMPGVPAEVVIYASDAWTVGTASLFGSMSASLYDELTGATDSSSWIYGPSLDILGPQVIHRPEVKLLDSIRQLRSEIKRRFKRLQPKMTFKRFRKISERPEMTFEDFLKISEQLIALPPHGAYLEAKARVVVGMDAFLTAYLPDPGHEEYSRFLRSAGYEGPIRLMPITEEERVLFLEESAVPSWPEGYPDFLRYQYSWKVAERIRADLPGLKV